MHDITFDQATLDAIRHDRYHHPHPRVQRKMEVLWLISQDLTHEETANLAGVSRRTVQRYVDEYRAGSLAQVRRLPWQGRDSALSSHQASLEDYFLDHPPRSTREAQVVIEEQTGVRRGLTQVRAFLKKFGPALAESRNDTGQGRSRQTG